MTEKRNRPHSLTTVSQAPGGPSPLRAVAGAWLSGVLCCVLLGACVSPPAAQGDDGPLGADAPTSAALWDWEALEQPLASRIDGISDQNLPYWGGSGNGPLVGLSANAWLGGAGPHLGYARYVVQWDVMSRRTREPYRHYYEAFVDWYREVHALGLSADVAFGLYTGAPPASADAYRSAIEELLSAFPVPYIEAFNEPNGTANLSAATAAHFFNQAYGYCERHGCEAIAGDFLDTAGAASYALQYKRALSPTEYPRERDPPDWGLHPYVAVNRGGGEAQAIRRELPAPDSLWITEVGAYYCEAPDDMDGFGEAGQAANAWRLVNVVIPALAPLHVFYYELSYKDGELTPCDQYSDTALYVGIEDRPRAAAGVLLG